LRVLITGGAGFIGSHLAENCLKKGHEVYIIDDLSTGNLENLRPLQTNPEYQGKLYFIQDSILNSNVMLELVGICDVVYHMAAAVGVEYIIANPLSSIVTNVRGTETVLELCSKFKKRILLASTSEVYGKHDHAPLVETDDCVYGPSERCRWSYAAGKLMDEFTGLAYYRTKGLPVLITRLFNTVGPRQTGRYGMVIPRLVRQALLEEPITVYGDGEQTRTFTHVKEVVHALTLLMESPDAVGEVVNIGGVEEVSILQLAKRIIQLTNSGSEIKIVPYDKAYPKDFEDMRRRVPSTDKLRKIVGFAPSMKLDEILIDVIKAWKEPKMTAESEKRTKADLGISSGRSRSDQENRPGLI
jgi:UDP-glucose 4-epimerase